MVRPKHQRRTRCNEGCAAPKKRSGQHSSTSVPDKPSAEALHRAILQLEEPVVFKNLLQESNENLWKFLDWSFTDLAEKFGDLKLPFRIGVNAKTSEPQWDFKCKEKKMTLAEFLDNVQSLDVTKEWQYFDYKHMGKWFHDNPEILEAIDWSRFGFDAQGEESTLWIGSRGAHTNCHQDSYGFNLVAQIHGRKRWILFPADSGALLDQTRIPYEESTVYSSFNFFCPSEDEEKDILRIAPKGRMIVLEPGQVLLVPSGWWHYVESLDLSTSVNTWIPLEKDHKSRLGEAVVELLVNVIGEGRVPTSDESPLDTSEALNMVKTCIERCTPEKKRKRPEWSAEEFREKYPTFVSSLPILDVGKLQEYLSNNRRRFSDIEYHYSKDETEDGKPENDNEKEIKTEENEINSSCKTTTNILLKALCHPEVIEKVTQIIILESSRSK